MRKRKTREALRFHRRHRHRLLPPLSLSLSLFLILNSSLTFQKLADVLDKLCARKARSTLLVLGQLLLSFGCGSRGHVFFFFDRNSSCALID